MLIDLQLYTQDFESKFIFETTKLYLIQSKTRIQDGSFSLPEYLDYINLILTQENDKILHYLDISTRRLLNPCIRKQLIETHIEAIINKGFDDLLRAERIKELHLMYDFICSVKNGEENLRAAFEEFIKKEGYELVRYPEKDKTMIKELLDFKKSIDVIIVQAFKDNGKFIISMKKGFEKFINMRPNKPAEMIAKYLDAMLIAGHKGASSDEELDTNMDKIMVIFRFIYGKDIFEGFYKQNLSKRLLHGKSASVDAEKAMLIKLKQECGPDFTSKLEEMFKDIELSMDLSHTFKEQSNKKQCLDMNVNVLSKANWPSYQGAKVNMPIELSSSLGNFQTYYKSNYSGRTLEWQHSLGHCKLKANFPLRSKELHVSFFQTLVLLLFNSSNVITFQKISEITSITTKELKMTLIALTMGKVKVLQKSLKGTNIENDTEFIYNENFNHHLHSIKINQVQMKESEEENDKTRTKVIYDRNMQMDAGIMRIMKTRKKLNHSNLLRELSEQSNFPIRQADFKKRIENLIEHDYIKRNEDEPNLYEYLA
ncbi:Cullin-4B-like [Oopsacas minuta]|uniref:Cullin-4B-like n=1 Tax=Oopsacas minuta TaxID=111878 RepID=A0AAV7K3D3_9METZ|nr:Cullin-4B-like [Oopsacas minuta]